MRIETYIPARQRQVSALADCVLGEGFFERPAQIQRDSESYVLVAIDKQKEVVGFVRGRLLPKDGLGKLLEHRLLEIPDDLCKADADGGLGVIQTIVVAPGYQGKGLVTKLLRVVHDKIIGHGADKLIVAFKKSRRSVHVDHLMEKLGFAFWVKLETYWQRPCDFGDFTCVDRDGACSCEAVFYRKRVF